MPKVLNLPFKDDIRRPDRDNAIDVYLSDDECDDVLARRRVAARLHRAAQGRSPREQKKAWIAQMSRRDRGLATPSSPSATTWSAPASPACDYIAEPGGSIRDDNVIEVGQQVRHRHGLHRHAPVPSLIGRLGPCLGPKVSVVEPFAAALSRAAVLRHNG